MKWIDMKDEILYFAKENAPYSETYADDEQLWNQTIALATAYCVLCEVEVDTRLWDEFIAELYEATETEMPFEMFESLMAQYVV